MTLAVYKKKRSFRQTPEPKGKKQKSSPEGLRFVVQKHDASRLHYDFRLEMEGVLKSWAVPKGPSLNPDDKRLAMMVEDHPYDYRSFEGTIPPGNYGAGTVIVWDEGTYEPMEPTDEAVEQEKVVLRQLQAGDLKIILKGKKLKGAYALVQMKGRGENAWLLIKKKDKYASTTDITKKGKSVVSGKTIEQIESAVKQHGSGKDLAPGKTTRSLSSPKKNSRGKKGKVVRKHPTRVKGPAKKR